MELLTKLNAQVTGEGKQEAKSYVKFACFCMEQTDDKLYNIWKSESILKNESAQTRKLELPDNKDAQSGTSYTNNGPRAYTSIPGIPRWDESVGGPRNSQKGNSQTHLLK